MTIWRKVAGPALAVITAVAMAGGGSAMASPTSRAPSTQLTVLQTTDHFLDIAYTWKASWYGTKYPTIGKRDVAYSSSRLDGILNRVGIGPDSSANVVSWTPKGARQLNRRSLSGGAVALEVRLAIVGSAKGYKSGTFRVTNYLHLKQVDGKWKVFGARLPIAEGPTRWCDDSPAATAYCNIFPAGSN